MPTSRFKHVLVLRVGPLPSGRGYFCLCSCVDRFIRCPVAYEMSVIMADTIARTFISEGVNHSGVFATIKTERADNIGCSCSDQLTAIFGSARVRTTAYHAASNVLFERYRRQFKGALQAQAVPETWVDILPNVLIGLRSSLTLRVGPPSECMHCLKTSRGSRRPTNS